MAPVESAFPAVADVLAAVPDVLPPIDPVLDPVQAPAVVTPIEPVFTAVADVLPPVPPVLQPVRPRAIGPGMTGMCLRRGRRGGQDQAGGQGKSGVSHEVLPG